MTTFQVRYWFESSSRERSGEQVSELIDADDPHAAARRVQDNLSKVSFVITPSFGPAIGGFIVIHSALVRYVEIVPAPAGVPHSAHPEPSAELP